MIFLDANVFYWYYGRDRLELSTSDDKIDVKKLCQYLDVKKDKAMPTSVFMEIFVHFRSDAQKLISMRNFIIEKGFRLYNNLKEYGVEPEQLDILSLMTSHDIVKYANGLFNKKVEIESNYAYMFLSVLRELYLYYAMNEYSNFTDENKNSILQYIWVNVWREEKDPKIRLKSALENGYKVDKPDQYLKEEYLKLLTEDCYLIKVILSGIDGVKKNEADLVNFIKQQLNEFKQNKNVTHKTVMQHFAIVMSNDRNFLNYATNNISNSCIKVGMPKGQADYIAQQMLPAWLNRAQQIKKNDIFDMFCMNIYGCSYTPENTTNVLIDTSPYLLTFDTTMKKYIKNNKPNNYSIIEKFYIK